MGSAKAELSRNHYDVGITCCNRFPQLWRREIIVDGVEGLAWILQESRQVR